MYSVGMWACYVCCCQHFSSSSLSPFHSTNTFQAGERTNTKTCFLRIRMKLVFIFWAFLRNFATIFHSLLLLLWICVFLVGQSKLVFILVPLHASCKIECSSYAAESMLTRIICQTPESDFISDANLLLIAFYNVAVGVYVWSAQTFIPSCRLQIIWNKYKSKEKAKAIVCCYQKRVQWVWEFLGKFHSTSVKKLRIE